MNRYRTAILALSIITLASIVYASILLAENLRLKAAASVPELYKYYHAHLQRIGESWEDFSLAWGGRSFAEIKQKYGA
jgi:hypothetical protein